MPKLTLYHATPSRSAVTLWMLEETGAPYDLKLLKLADGENLKPDYLAINPMGKVPALRVSNGSDDVIVTEVAAICAYLADAFLEKKLAPPLDNPRRGLYYKWLLFAPSVIEPAVQDKLSPRKEPPRAAAVGWRELDSVLEIVAKAVVNGPYILGEQFTAADVVVGSLLNWGMMFGFVPKRPEFEPYVARLTARPAAKRAVEKDKALAAG